MVLNIKQLIGLPVVTRSGQKIGKVATFDVDVLTGKMTTLYVKASNLVARLSGDELLVAWDAILEITDKQVVIIDSVIQAQAPASTVATSMAPTASATMMRQV